MTAIQAGALVQVSVLIDETLRKSLRVVRENVNDLITVVFRGEG